MASTGGHVCAFSHFHTHMHARTRAHAHTHHVEPAFPSHPLICDQGCKKGKAVSKQTDSVAGKCSSHYNV